MNCPGCDAQQIDYHADGRGFSTGTFDCGSLITKIIRDEYTIQNRLDRSRKCYAAEDVGGWIHAYIYTPLPEV